MAREADSTKEAPIPGQEMLDRAYQEPIPPQTQRQSTGAKPDRPPPNQMGQHRRCGRGHAVSSVLGPDGQQWQTNYSQPPIPKEAHHPYSSNRPPPTAAPAPSPATRAAQTNSTTSDTTSTNITRHPGTATQPPITRHPGTTTQPTITRHPSRTNQPTITRHPGTTSTNQGPLNNPEAANYHAGHHPLIRSRRRHPRHPTQPTTTSPQSTGQDPTNTSHIYQPRPDPT